MNAPQTAPLDATSVPSNTPVTLPARIEGTPRVFLSYSWDGEDHKAWVKALAERLQIDGIQVIFDRWHLKLGQDKLHFMERAVADSDYVAIVCTEKYAKRANQREGGVGWESMIITSEVAEHMLTDKFIPILRKGTFETSLPRYLKTRLGVNLTSDPYNEDAYEELLRKFHGEPIAPPPIGARPDFSKKTAPKPKTLLQAAGEALATQGSTMKIELVWNQPNGATASLPPFTVSPKDPDKDDEELQIAKAKAAAQALLQRQFGSAPPPDQFSIKVIKD